ncbi:MAG: type II toxin-antitoxin system VapC family toxin [Alphaproteobacteria bacterium]
MRPVLVDSNVILDVAGNDKTWQNWSANALAEAANSAILVINPLVYAEVSVGYRNIEDLEYALPTSMHRRDNLPYEAAFLAGKCFLAYRQRGGSRTSPMPYFYIGAHAAVSDYRLLTRDVGRYKGFFPTLDLIIPN